MTDYRVFIDTLRKQRQEREASEAFDREMQAMLFRKVEDFASALIDAGELISATIEQRDKDNVCVLSRGDGQDIVLACKIGRDMHGAVTWNVSSLADTGTVPIKNTKGGFSDDDVPAQECAALFREISSNLAKRPQLVQEPDVNS